ncbi:MAG TPA: Xaa-Pro peptidase family protein [Bryobacteraceae bacterium]|nr:Xaa-Pro peptidase family protein [Bryobacteraceae bacterium]
MLTTEGCRARQQRLFAEMAGRRLDLFVSGNFRTVYYFTGRLAQPDAPCAFLAWADGETALVAPAAERGLAGIKREVAVYAPERAVSLPHGDAAVMVKDLLAGRPAGRVGLDRTSVESTAVRDIAGEEASGLVLQLRRRKEADEVDEIRTSLRLCAVAYDAARQAIHPGETELGVYLAMHAAIAQAYGEAVPFPGDFACGLRSVRGGGPATDRVLAAGDLFPLDLFPAPALYFGDTCRTFCAGEPTAGQHASWKLVCDALALGERLVRPGARGADVYREIKAFLDDAELTAKSFWHHAGHGIGLHGHEAPRIIANTDDALEPGDVFTLEPGVYTDATQGGIRLENNYLVTAGGIEKLFDYPLEL